MSTTSHGAKTRRWPTFVAGFVFGSVVAGISVVAIAESRFAALSPLAFIEAVANNSAFPSSNLAKGLRTTLESSAVADRFRLNCGEPNSNPDTQTYIVGCQQRDLFELLPSIGLPYFTMRVCDGQVCEFGRWRK
jgi:hypothetical protein